MILFKGTPLVKFNHLFDVLFIYNNNVIHFLRSKIVNVSNIRKINYILDKIIVRKNYFVLSFWSNVSLRIV